MTFSQLEQIFSYDLQGSYCIEILFCVHGMPDYQDSWMGKTPNRNDPAKDVYWFGLVEDGSQAYDYDSFSAFAFAPVFHGETLRDVCDRIELIEINGLDPKNRLGFYGIH